MPPKRKRTERCSVCGHDQTEDPVGTAVISWLLCSVCKKWSHVQCFESTTSTGGALTEGLWDFLHTNENLLDQWNFSCYSCSEAAQSIPEQLENQSLVTRQQLIDMGVDVKFLSTEIKTVDPVPVNTGAATNTGPVSTGPSTSTGTVDPAAIVPASNPPETLNITELIKFFMVQNAEEKAKQERKDERQERIRNEEKAERERKDAEQERIRKEEKDERLRLEAKRDKERNEDKAEAERIRKEEKAEAERIRKEDKEEAQKEQMRREVKHDMELAQKDQAARDELRRQGQMMREDSKGGDKAPQAFADKSKGGIKLPTLKLPNFNGDALKWMEFWDMFQATVHQDPDLSPVQKLGYLKANLDGPAKQSIAQLTLTNDNYDVAVELLKKRYGDKKVIQDKLFFQLRTMPPATMKLEELRRTFHSVEQILAQLKNVDQDFKENADSEKFLLDILIKKFPPHLVIEMEKWHQGDWTFTSFMERLEYFISLQEKEANMKSEIFGSRNASSSFHGPATSTFTRNPPTFTRNQPSPVKSSFFPKPKGSADALMATSGQRNSRPDRNGKVFQPIINNSNQVGNAGQNRMPTYPCVFCDGNHLPDDCPKYSTADLRKTQLYLGKRCYMCLKTGHTWKNCKSPWKQRPCKGCNQVGYHHFSLCRNWISRKFRGRSPQSNVTFRETQSNMPINSSVSSVPPPVSAANHMATGGEMAHSVIQYKSVMQTTRIPVQNPVSKDILQANIFLDSGSNICWMTTEFCRKLALKEQYRKTITVKTFGTLNQKVIHCSVTNVDLFTVNHQLFPIEVTVVEHLASPISKPALSSDDLEFLEANKNRYKLAPETTSQREGDFPVDIIIGQNYYWQIVTMGEKAVNLPSGLQLIPSKLGYFLGGQTMESKSSPHSYQSISHYVMTEVNEVLSTLTRDTKFGKAEQPALDLEDFWSLERIGIMDSPTENDDDHALARFNKTIKFENDRYHATWMWKSDDINLPDNYLLALGRFKALAKRFVEDKDLYQKYAAIIEEQLQKGIIEKVTGNTEIGPRQHYLPHHPVITPLKETTKVRIVYDASARIRKGANSLNDCLYRGPVILPDLCGLLLRFRTYPVAILADIEKAFLQIGLQIPDRDVTRFLWFRNPDEPNLRNPERDIQIYRFCRVAFGVICSPSILEATIRYHLNQVGTDIAQNIADNIYVDNVLVGARNPDEAYQIYSVAKQVFSIATMNLREWTSNSMEFMDRIPEKDQAKTTKTALKVLGLQWCLKDDEIYVSGPNAEKLQSADSKRHVLHALAQIFDPLGFFAPVTYHGKRFLERLWAVKLSWDDLLSDELKKIWDGIAEILADISSVKLPRFLGIPEATTEFQLMVFCDASGTSYGTAVYLRFYTGVRHQTDLIFAKNRLSPKIKDKNKDTKPTTLPRLELLGVVIGVRAANFTRRELKLNISQTIIWTDSECVLHWLRSKKSLGVFVENRLKEIRQAKDFNFRYVSSADNPADLITRGTTVTEIKDNSLWWHGPKWLQSSSEHWPSANLPELTPKMMELIESESKKGDLISFSTGEGPAEKIQKSGISAVMENTRFSRLGKLLRATCYVMRFARIKVWNRLSADTKEKFGEKIGFFNQIESEGALTAKEIGIAENLWVGSLQRQAYATVFEDILNRKRNPLQMQLGLRIGSDGLLRCHGRLENADISYDTKFPILLPTQDHYTTLLIEDTHRRVYHNGTPHTLAQIRMNFWIPKGRKAVATVIRKCLVCRRYHGGPYRLPRMPNLPKQRVNQRQPFQSTGIDYLGPIYIKNAETVSKAWICLFTCLTVRAVHLEVVISMDTKSFLDCFRRFVALQGKPDEILSDNAPTFKLADKTLNLVWSQVITDPEVLEYFSREKIRWSFITELAPWQGGVYERLVGVVKKCLKKALGRQFFDLLKLQTILYEIQAVVNTRPLTYVYSEVGDGLITPAHFLRPSGLKIGFPTTEEDHADPEFIPGDVSSAQRMQLYLRQQQNKLDRFWEFWEKEYLLSLRERYQTDHKNPRVHVPYSPTVGEIVLVDESGGNASKNRGTWTLAKVIQLFQDRDGAIRNVRIQLPGGRLFNRSVTYVYPLEIYSEDGINDPDVPVNAERADFSKDKDQNSVPMSLRSCVPETKDEDQNYIPMSLRSRVPDQNSDRRTPKIEESKKLKNKNRSCVPERAAKLKALDRIQTQFRDLEEFTIGLYLKNS